VRLCADDVPAAQSDDGSRRRLYSYVSGSDDDRDDEDEGPRGAQRQRQGDWRTPASHDDDDDDGMSSPSWVRSGSGSPSDAGVDDDDEVARTSDVVGHRRVNCQQFGVYSRINDSGQKQQQQLTVRHGLVSGPVGHSVIRYRCAIVKVRRSHRCNLSLFLTLTLTLELFGLVNCPRRAIWIIRNKCHIDSTCGFHMERIR